MKYELKEHIIYDSTECIIDKIYQEIGNSSESLVFRLQLIDQPEFFPLVYEDEIEKLDARDLE